MFNPHKAGLERVDKDRVNEIIEESSRGTPFWENQQRKNARHQERIEKALEKLEIATEKEWSAAQALADEYLKQLELDVQRVVVHVDMDAFFASVEERDNPVLKEKPMAVGSHSMISTSNYVARRFGVRAGLPGFIALKLCPQLVLVYPDMKKYSEASSKVMEVLSRYDPHMTIFGLDEAALDITELCQNSEKTAEEIVSEIRQDVRNTTNLTCSAGIGPNQMVAKMFADVNKPDGQFRLETAGEIESFIQNSSVRKISGVGVVQEKILTALNCVKCSDFIEQRAKLFLVFNEATAKFYLAAARGICGETLDESEVSSRTRRSKSAETTFKDSDNVDFLVEVCNHLSERLSEDLELSNLKGKLITVKFKTSSFDVFSRSVALELPTDSQKTISSHSTRILKSMLSRSPGLKLRLLGVRMSNFHEADAKQPTLSQLLKSAEPTCSEREADTIVSEKSGAPSSPQPGPSKWQPPSSPPLNPSIRGGNSTSDFDDVKGPPSPKEFPGERRESNSPEVAAVENLIAETYCPVCAVIMRNYTEARVNRHINQCLNREETRDKLKRSNSGGSKLTPKETRSKAILKKRTSHNSKRRDISSITNFFNK